MSMSATPRDRCDRAPQMVQWLTLAKRLQLERDLDDLPELAQHLEENYDDLLARGSRDPDNPLHRYPIEPTALDLGDRRTKGFNDDPIGEADLARRIGERRLGVLPTLVGWVGLAAGEMHDLDVQHREPTDPDQIVWVVDGRGQAWASKPGPTIASECLWLRQHVDWVAGQQWVTEFAAEVSDIVADLIEMVGDGTTDSSACMTADQIHEAHIASRATVYRWWQAGALTDAGKDGRKRVFVVHEIRALRDRKMACR